mmetsp:Transcript_28476/g.43700  ORF Transcript_28476/g.43700 Transcript_28476/m.43700 type:complete len:218 (-) Transcript_28476:23-676(-)|eukprot:CAMPEP_0195294740 /NCGR_PEP_ID=MMETSP0707-20130614/15795_1 /TAXON_ID=33640 /ORGANISM="Asterionellopsis glacialis, Strain CCMP134" /LENGTH=217 /DNA_ID=CAMNT_0040355791 /DNA_START=193 /DNA_END=846 /DNA_ORIENTATION=+
MRPLLFLATLLLLVVVHHGVDATLRGQTQEKKNKDRRLSYKPQMQMFYKDNDPDAAWNQDSPSEVAAAYTGNQNWDGSFNFKCDIAIEVTCKNLEGGEDHACGEIDHGVIYGADGISALLTVKITNLSTTNNVALKGVATIGNLVDHTNPILGQFRDEVILKNSSLEVQLPFNYQAIAGTDGAPLVLRQIVNVSAYVKSTEMTCRDSDQFSFSVVLK